MTKLPPIVNRKLWFGDPDGAEERRSQRLNTDLIEPGWFILTEGAILQPYNCDQGVVLDVRTSANPETGEISRAFAVVNQVGGRINFRTVPEHAVADMTMPNVAVIRDLYRRLAQQTARRKGMLTSEDAQAVEASLVLARVSGIMPGAAR